MKAVRPEVTIVGVQTNDSDAMAQSVKTGERLRLENVGLAAEGTAVKEVGVGAFRLASALVDDFVLVDTDAARATIKDVFEDARTVLPGPTRSSLAPLLGHRTINARRWPAPAARIQASTSRSRRETGGPFSEWSWPSPK